MSELIFHHYPNSPFSEKIRLIFGYKNLSWRSVLIPTIMPKPDLVELTGGYRRTPVLQIGADIYCDTALIADRLEQWHPDPTLYPPAQAALARTMAQWSDSTLFWTAIGHVFQPAGMAGMFDGLPPEALQAFIADRAALRAQAPRMAAAEASGQLSVYLARFESMLLTSQAYLLGEQPTLTDFSVYHALWYVRRATAVASILDASPSVVGWMNRMAAIGHGTDIPMTSEEALSVAKNSVPQNSRNTASRENNFIDHHGAVLGDRVTIMPTDYGLDPVQGRLVLSSATEFALERDTDKVGKVVVHFPRLGFQLKKI